MPINVQLIALKKELSDIDLQLERNQETYDENQVRLKLQSVISENLKSCTDGSKCLDLILEISRQESVSAIKTPGTILGFKRFISQLEGARSQTSNGYTQLIAMYVEKTGCILFLVSGMLVGFLSGILGAILFKTYQRRMLTPR